MKSINPVSKILGRELKVDRWSTNKKMTCHFCGKTIYYPYYTPAGNMACEDCSKAVDKHYNEYNSE